MMMLAVTPLTLEVKSSTSTLAAWVNGPDLKDATDGLFTFGRVDDHRSRLNAASQQGRTASALSCLLQTLCRESESGSVTPSPFPSPSFSLALAGAAEILQVIDSRSGL